jgi:hypothetical protein
MVRQPGLQATRLGVLAVITPVVGWSFANTIVRIAHVPALMFAFYRLWLGALAMVVLLAATRRRLTWTMVKSAATGGLLLALNIVFFFSAIKQTKVAIVAVGMVAKRATRRRSPSNRREVSHPDPFHLRFQGNALARDPRGRVCDRRGEEARMQRLAWRVVAAAAAALAALALAVPASAGRSTGAAAKQVTFTAPVK